LHPLSATIRFQGVSRKHGSVGFWWIFEDSEKFKKSFGETEKSHLLCSRKKYKISSLKEIKEKVAR